mgnify:CR=1 FL=1
MKFENGIEVSGIERVVIDRKFVWQVREYGWHLIIPDNAQGKKTFDEMATWIKLMVLNPKYRAWVHGDTINIVRRDRE